MKSLHFIGIGGISMSSLAAFAALSGKYDFVSGSDRASGELTQKLEKLGVKICIPQSEDNIPADGDLTVVYTAAIAQDNPELVRARQVAKEVITRAEFLGRIMLERSVRIGIAGTHGKSTTTAMLGCIWKCARGDETVIDGAVMKNYSSAYKIGEGDSFIFEACEYTDSFLSFFPTTAVVTNVEFDHADYFHSEQDYIKSFAKYISLASKAIVNLDSCNARAITDNYKGNLVTCSASDMSADYTARNISFVSNRGGYELYNGDEKLCNISLSVVGAHNVENSLTAAVSAYENGIAPEYISQGLASYSGIKRRLELIKEENGIEIYDDYAHHPSEIKASLSALKQDGKRIICIYQPHSVSRTAELFEDFVNSFGGCDLVIFTDIYENLEKDTGASGVTSRDLSAKVKNSIYIKDFDEIADYINRNAKSGDIIVTMGAGNVYRILDMLK